MNCIQAKDKKQIKRFKKFRRTLYQNDPFYVSTVEFTVDMLLDKTTKFSKSCIIRPIMIEENQYVLAQCVLVKYPCDDFVQMAFFEALEGQEQAVDLMKEQAKAFAKEMGVSRIIVGLNGHLSYGVGLSLDMEKPNTFDSTYTKTYYPQYFKDGEEHKLVAFRNNLDVLRSKLIQRPSKIIVRPIDFQNFSKEMKAFKQVCDETIGTTFLYSPTQEKHFEELIGEMKFFLRKENILFAFDGNEMVGFLFWHPDYNEILKKGKQNSLLSIALRYTLFKKKIQTIKVNSIGVKEKYQGRVTIQLLNEMMKHINSYTYAETNFVWENNRKSMAINKHIGEHVERSFAVYEYKI